MYNNGITSLLQTSKTAKSTSIKNEFHSVSMTWNTCRSAPRSRLIVFSVTWTKQTTEAGTVPPCKRAKYVNKTASANRV